MEICVTGHRPNELFGYYIHSEAYNKIRHSLKLAIYTLLKDCDDKDVTVYSGMALGVDQIFVEEMVKARAYYKSKGINFRIVAAVPFESQDCKWPEASKKLYHELLDQCDEKVVVSEGKYSPILMQKRNEFMVDHSDCVIAVWDGSRGGTGNCVEYARKQEKHILYITPANGVCHDPFVAA